jgi:hypothetical protein
MTSVILKGVRTYFSKDVVKARFHYYENIACATGVVLGIVVSGIEACDDPNGIVKYPFRVTRNVVCITACCAAVAAAPAVFFVPMIGYSGYHTCADYMFPKTTSKEF